MGWIKDLAVKTATKKSLLDITEDIEDLLRKYPKYRVEEILDTILSRKGLSNRIPTCGSWKGVFLCLVVISVRQSLAHDPNFADNMPIIASLTVDWVKRHGGQVDNMLQDINSIISESVH